jgi:hypothetical protein
MRLRAALWGVALGAAVALIFACVIFPPPGAYVDRGFGILWTDKWTSQEDREKGFYIFTLLLSIGIGYFAAKKSIGAKWSPVIQTLLLILLVPVMTEIIGRAMVAGRIAAAGYGIAGVLIITVAILAVRKSSEYFGYGDRIDAQRAIVCSPVQVAGTHSRLSRALIFLMATGVIVLLIVPVSFRGIATAIGYNMHMVSFVIGPATYAFDKGLIPGVDYFTQYSVGTPWLFSFFLAPTAAQTILNAVRFVVAENVFFYLTFFCFLWWLLRGWGWALTITLAGLMLEFTTEQPFYAPSSTAARYPMLMVVACLYALWVNREFALSVTIALAMAVACALFTNTETGVYAAAAISVATLLANSGLARSIGKIALLGVLSFTFFVTLNLIAFGPATFDVRYFWYLAEPLMLYSTGLGAWPIEWGGGLYWLYNIITPGLALASVAWVAVVARRQPLPFPRAQIAALAMISLIGLFMMAKYINMSIVGLWQVNSLGFLIVVAWWARALVERLPDRWIGRYFWLRFTVTAPLAVILAAFLCVIHDDRNPSVYAIMSYRTYPSLINVLLRQPVTPDCAKPIQQCLPLPVSREDIALISRLTKPSDRVAILNLYDWVYLIEAHRASKFMFLPSAVMFTERQYNESMRGLNLIFLPREPKATLGVEHPSLVPVLDALLRKDFKVVAQGQNLLAWKRVR